MLLKTNSSFEEQLRETRARIVQLEEQYRCLQEQHQCLELKNTQSQDQLANLRSAHALLTSSHYELLDRLNRASQSYFGVRKSVREIVKSVAQFGANMNGQDAIPTQAIQNSNKEQSGNTHDTPEAERR